MGLFNQIEDITVGNTFEILTHIQRKELPGWHFEYDPQCIQFINETKELYIKGQDDDHDIVSVNFKFKALKEAEKRTITMYHPTDHTTHEFWVFQIKGTENDGRTETN